MKRLMDIVLSLAALVLLSPVLVLVTLWIVLDSGRPVFFRQTRVGRGGQPFGILKFRSMRIDAAATGPYFTQANDPRITGVGRFIRRTSIDELPQLLNVLWGDMSLVGPRPDVPAQQSLYAPDDWVLRCSVRPGITGLAQVRGRSQASFEQRLAYDLEYVKNASVGLDLRVFWWTICQLGGRHSN
ncbi:MAG: sugar transferase [Polaromonas sp.]|uniref:sugar transferase n=1 Tax=Polaromonas sp. TaxID=1869339 RepID=UPI0025D68CC0|nr:sugar transferase [Polaromonas sp.]MBI2728648.1 sugar transferase [Polaromonas sp.]